MYQILIADDDQAMLQMVEQVLSHEGYDVVAVDSGNAVLDIIQDDTPDLFLIDVALPDVDGVQLCRKLRSNPSTNSVPIVFLTGHSNIYSVTEALGAGGDDYIRKPFAVRELTARIRAHLRRSANYSTDELASLKIVPDTYQAFVDDREVMLTRIEFDLLHYMVLNIDKWHATQDLLTDVWNYPEGVGDTALVRNHIRNLRRKLEINPDHPAIIQSRHGRGYSIRANIQFPQSAK